MFVPWDRNAPWWGVFLEGIAALALGGLILSEPRSVGQWLVLLVGSYVLVTSLLDLYVARFGALPASAALNRTLVGCIGVVVGLLVFGLPLVVAVSTLTLVAVLGIGLLWMGLFGIGEALLGHEDRGIILTAVLGHLPRLLFGGLLLFVVIAGVGAAVLQWLGIVAVVGGVALCSYAIILYRRPAAST